MLLECLSLNHQLSIDFAYNGIYGDLGYAAFKMGDYDTAEDHFQNSFKAAIRFSFFENQVKCLSYFGRLALTKNKLEPALEYLTKALKLAIKENCYLSELLVGYADYYTAINEPAKALKLSMVVLNDPHAEKRDKNQAKELCDELSPKLSEQETAQAIKNSKSLKLEEIVEEALRLTKQ